MGACIGKKNSKYLKRKKCQSDTTKVPQIIIQDDSEEKKSSPTPSKNLPVTNGSAGNQDDDNRLSKIDEISINSELRNFLEEQKLINAALAQPIFTSIVSVTDTELEFELANLIFEQLQNGQVEDIPTATTNT